MTVFVVSLIGLGAALSWLSTKAARGRLTLEWCAGVLIGAGLLLLGWSLIADITR